MIKRPWSSRRKLLSCLELTKLYTLAQDRQEGHRCSISKYPIITSSFTVWLMHLYDSRILDCMHNIGIHKGLGLQPYFRGCSTDMLIYALAALLRNTITLQYTPNYFEQNKWHLPFQEISKGGMCEIDKQTKGRVGGSSRVNLGLRPD